MSLVIFCLLFSFVDYVPVKGEIIMFKEIRLSGGGANHVGRPFASGGLVPGF